MHYIVDNQIFNLTTYNRSLILFINSLGSAFIIFVGLIYMVLKGNADKESYSPAPLNCILNLQHRIKFS